MNSLADVTCICRSPTPQPVHACMVSYVSSVSVADSPNENDMQRLIKRTGSCA